jgi:hypothetical protein
MTVAKEISKYKSDLVGVQEVKWDRGGTEPAGEYTVTDLINALPSNSSVNTIQQATIDEAVFSMSSAPRLVLVTDQ